jgi:hypothetical protein
VLRSSDAGFRSAAARFHNQGFSFSFQMPFPMISSSRTGEGDLNETFNPSMQISVPSGPKP